MGGERDFARMSGAMGRAKGKKKIEGKVGGEFPFLEEPAWFECRQSGLLQTER